MCMNYLAVKSVLNNIDSVFIGNELKAITLGSKVLVMNY